MSRSVNTALPMFVREPGFDAAVAALTKNHRRMHELDEAIEWGLLRKPDHFYNIAEDYYLWKTEKLVDGVPQLRILYRYNAEEHAVNLIAAGEVQAGEVE